MSEDCKGASGIESQAPNGAGIDIVLVEDTMD